LAIDARTHEIVGAYIRDRSEKAAHGLWDSLLPVYRQCAVSYTDFWAAYGMIFHQNSIVLLVNKVDEQIILSD
jgi:IS1 family transposase